MFPLISMTVTLQGFLRMAFFFCFCADATQSTRGSNTSDLVRFRGRDDDGKREERTRASASEGLPRQEHADLAFKEVAWT